MEKVESNTHIATLTAWRAQGLDAEWVQEVVRGAGEPKAHTAKELLMFLCEGSPAMRLVFQEILDGKLLEPPYLGKYNHWQKLIVAEANPPPGWYMEMVLRCALLDARMMHSALSNHARSSLVDLFNDPQSSLKILILLLDVSAVGLNLHVCCDRMVATALAKSYAQQAQAMGRIDRVRISLVPKYFM